MAVTESPSKVSVAVKLNNGIDSSGKVKTVSVSLGSLSTEGYTNEKCWAVIEALAPCLSLVMASVQKTAVSIVDSDE